MTGRWISPKEFLTDFRSGMAFEELMSKYGLEEERFDRICRLLNQSETFILQILWGEQKLTDTQFARAFSELNAILNNIGQTSRDLDQQK